MGIQNFKFPVTIPIDITFFNAESLSPSKLNAIFNYIKNATSSIEMFIGNGIDFDITDTYNKRLIGNLSNAIGRMAGTIYKPYNKIDLTYSLYKRYFSTYSNKGNLITNTFHNAEYHDDDYILVNNEVCVPINRSFDKKVIVGIHYTIKKKISGTPDSSSTISCYIYTNGSTSVSEDPNSDTPIPLVTTTALTDILASKKYIKDIPHNNNTIIEAGTFIDYISFDNKDTSKFEFKIFAIYIAEITDTQTQDNLTKLDVPINVNLQITGKSIGSASALVPVPYNNFYSIGLDHKSYITCQLPCKWSKSEYNIEGLVCDKVTVLGSCIGNTYDIYIDNGAELNSKLGVPVCAGSYTNAGIYPELLPHNGVSLVKYEASYSGIEIPPFFVLQSPLSLYNNKPGTFKYHPFSLINQIDGQAIPQGKLMIYDANASDGSHVIWNTRFNSTNRPDIVKVTSKSVSPGNYKKYLVLSSETGIADMNLTILKNKSDNISRNIAVYSD